MAGRNRTPEEARRTIDSGWIAPLAVLLVGIAVSRMALAEPRRIEVVVAAAPAAADSVLSVLRGALGRRGLDMDATVAPRIDPQHLLRSLPDGIPTGSLARLWLDLVATPPTMYLVAAPTSLVYVRPLAVGAEPDSVELELIRFVVDSSVQAISEGRALGVSREEFERSLAPPVAAARPALPSPPVPPPRPQRRWAIAAGYSGALLSPDVVAHGPEVSVELRWPHLQFGVALLQRAPLTIDRADVSFRLISTGLRISAAAPVALGQRLSASFGVGAEIDATHVAPDGAGATSAYWVTDPLIVAVATVKRVFGDVVVSVDAGVDWDLLATRYDVIRSGETVVLWTPRRWRPFAAARLGFAF